MLIRRSVRVRSRKPAEVTLAPSSDAFGAALLAHHEGRAEGRELLLEGRGQRDDARIASVRVLPRAEDWQPWEREFLANIRGPVLDLGCGAGRHAINIQQRGIDVTGIDVSPGAVEVCRKRGLRDVRLQDLRVPPDDKSWQTVLMMCGNFGLACGWDETRVLLQRLHQVCAADAVLIADAVDGPLVRLRLHFGDVETPWWDLLNLPPSEVEPLIEGTGWTLEEHIVDGLQHAMRLRNG